MYTYIYKKRSRMVKDDGKCSACECLLQEQSLHCTLCVRRIHIQERLWLVTSPVSIFFSTEMFGNSSFWEAWMSTPNTVFKNTFKKISKYPPKITEEKNMKYCQRDNVVLAQRIQEHVNPKWTLKLTENIMADARTGLSLFTLIAKIQKEIHYNKSKSFA